MSTATLPFSCRSGALPRVIGAMSSASSFNYVDLDEVDSDEGLSEAMRIYYCLERLSFTPSGTVTEDANPTNTFTYGTIFTAPLPVTTNLTAYLIRGSIVANDTSTSSSSTSLASLEPAFRMGAQTRVDGAEAIRARWNYLTGTDNEDGSLDLAISYVVGVGWRLYYAFSFEGEGPIAITNPAWFPASTPDSTGTVDVLGYDLNFSVFSVWGYTVTGAGLTCTATEWTF